MGDGTVRSGFDLNDSRAIDPFGGERIGDRLHAISHGGLDGHGCFGAGMAHQEYGKILVFFGDYGDPLHVCLGAGVGLGVIFNGDGNPSIVAEDHCGVGRILSLIHI